MEKRDTGSLMRMASSSYYDDNGTPQSEDDFDYKRLGQELTKLHGQTTEVRYEIRYRRVIYQPSKIYVDYTYSGRFRINTPEGDRWLRRLADNRLVLARSGRDFQILSGM